LAGTASRESGERIQFVRPRDALELVSTCMLEDESFVAGDFLADV
jgi:hypothetical protein